MIVIRMMKMMMNMMRNMNHVHHPDANPHYASSASPAVNVITMHPQHQLDHDSASSACPAGSCSTLEMFLIMLMMMIMMMMMNTMMMNNYDHEDCW